MDRGQTCDVVDTPSYDWPALEEFQDREELSKWRDIQLGMYKILEIQDQGRNKYGPSVVLKLEHEKGPTVFVWAPSSLAYATQKRRRTDYILNVGAKTSQETDNGYFDFKLA